MHAARYAANHTARHAAMHAARHVAVHAGVMQFITYGMIPLVRISSVVQLNNVACSDHAKVTTPIPNKLSVI